MPPCTRIAVFLVIVDMCDYVGMTSNWKLTKITSERAQIKELKLNLDHVMKA